MRLNFNLNLHFSLITNSIDSIYEPIKKNVTAKKRRKRAFQTHILLQSKPSLLLTSKTHVSLSQSNTSLKQGTWRYLCRLWREYAQPLSLFYFFFSKPSFLLLLIL